MTRSDQVTKLSQLPFVLDVSSVKCISMNIAIYNLVKKLPTQW